MIEVVFEEYVNLESRFYLGDWSPAECNAGRFCEALVPPLSMLDRGFVTKQTPSVFAEKLLNPDIEHRLNAVDRKNMARTIASVYEIRSSRNSVHLASAYTADYVDSMFVLSACKWILCEVVRLLTGQANEQTARLLRGIAQLGDPVVFEVDGRPVVMRTDLSAPQEILLLLLHRPGYTATKADLVSFAAGYHKANAIGTALSRLEAKREIIRSTDGQYHLSPLGKTSALKLLPKV
jgi:hypothetical protein